MARTISEYFDERREECRWFSLVEAPNQARYLLESGSDEKRGRIILSLHMTERATLAISETITIGDKGLHREEYAYYLLIDGQEYWSRDLDKLHGYHGHTIGHKRIKAERITFKKAVEEAWEIVSQEEDLAQESPPTESN